jgi:hypothetical protein
MMKCIYNFFILSTLLASCAIVQSNIIKENKRNINDNSQINEENFSETISTDNNNNNDVDDATISSMSTSDQIRLLTKQLAALSTRRREDYKLLENSLKKYVRKNSLQFSDVDMRTELDQLR